MLSCILGILELLAMFLGRSSAIFRATCDQNIPPLLPHPQGAGAGIILNQLEWRNILHKSQAAHVTCASILFIYLFVIITISWRKRLRNIRKNKYVRYH